MASLTFPALVLAAVFIFHTETADAKTMVANREKRAPEKKLDFSEHGYNEFSISSVQKKCCQPRLGRKRSIDSTDNLIIDRNQLMDAVSLDPRLKEEYKKVFVKLLEEQLDKNPRLGENFFAYPRGGRAMDQTFSKHGLRNEENFFHWPRGGKRVDGLADDTCCSEGIITIYGQAGVKTYCKGNQCCEGLEKRYLEEDKDSLSVLCVPTEFNGAQEHATT